MDEHDDVKIEAEDPEADAQADKKVIKLKAEIEQLRKERQEYLDGWQRAKADYVNALRRFEGDVTNAKADGVGEAVAALLPAYDALERSGEHGEVPAGFLAIAKQLESAFKELGVETVGEVGERFNPALHEALAQDAATSAEHDDTITAVLEKGLRIRDQIIRPAKVKVAHFE